MTKMTPSCRKVWVKNSELIGQSDELNYGVTHASLKSKSVWVPI